MTQVAKSADDEFMVPLSDEEFEAMINGANTASVAVNNVEAAVENLKTQTSVEIQNPFEGLITGLQSMEGIEIPAEKFAGVATLASSLSKFGSKTATNAITTIPQIGRAFSQMAAELAKAPTISSNLVKMAEALSKYSRNAKTATTQTNRLGTSTGFLKGSLNGLYTPTMRAGRGFTSLAAIAGTLYANFFLLIRAARLLGKAMDYSSSMTEAQNVVSVVFGKSAQTMDDFAQTAIKDFGLAKLSAVEFASRFQAMGKTMGITSEQVVKANDFIASKISGNKRAYKDLGDSVADVSINLTKLTADIASLYNQDYEDVAKDMQSIYTGMTRPLRKYGLDLTNATLKEWALSQGLDSNIEKMTQAEKTMLRYQYVMSRAAGAMGDFQKTQDTWANSLRTVKQLLQEIARMVGEALINALRPALIAFKNFLFNFLQLTENALNALGKLLGWHQIDFGGASLVEDTEDYADALDDAAGAAKKLKNQLRAIDELNNLTTNNGNGGGAGDDIAGLGAGIESIWDQIIDTDRVYESNVKDWKDFGQRIANSMKEGLSQVNWDEIYSSSSTFGTNLANFLNGLIDPELWHLFGQTIAGGVMTAIEFAFSFGEEFDFENLGEAIGEGINGFFKEFDGGKLAKTLNVWADGLKATFKKAVGTIEWKEVFTDLFDFLNHIDIDTIGIFFAVGGTILGLPTITKALASALATQPLTLGLISIAAIGGFKIGEEISNQLDEALGVNPETGESRWYEWWETEFDFYLKAWEKAKPLWQGENSPYMLVSKSIALISFGGISSFGGKSIAQYLSDLFTEKHGFTLGDVWRNFWNPQEIADTILNSDAYKISDAITEVFTLGLGDWGEESPAKKAISWLEEKLPIIAQDFIILTEDIDLSGFVEKLAPVLSGIVAFGDPANVTGINNVGTAFGTLGLDLDDLKTKFTNFKTESADIFDRWYKEDIEPLFNSISQGAKDKWEEIKKFFGEEVPKWVENNVKPLFNKETWVSYLGGITEAFSQVWADAESFAKDFWNNISNFIEQVVNGVIDGLGKIAAAKDFLTGDTTYFNVAHIDIPTFANGGYPTTGSLFWAQEAGPELVGTMNGKTAVASNNEITGITAAINNASNNEMALLRQQNQLLQGILAKEFGISKNDLFNSVRSSAKQYTNMTGNPAF